MKEYSRMKTALEEAGLDAAMVNQLRHDAAELSLFEYNGTPEDMEIKLGVTIAPDVGDDPLPIATVYRAHDHNYWVVESLDHELAYLQEVTDFDGILGEFQTLLQNIFFPERNIGKPADGPIWTVVLAEDQPDYGQSQRIGVFHVHGAHADGVLEAVKASQARYEAALDEGRDDDTQNEIPHSYVDPVVFPGQLTALN